MDHERDHVANMIGEAIRGTRNIRENVVALLNESNCGIYEGSLALLTTATVHLKDEGISKEEFLELCDIIYSLAIINPDGNGDVVTTPRTN